jgi:phosphatidylglycerophosphate synthase
MAPGILLLGVAGHGLLVAAVLILCGATDLLDGRVARRSRVVSAQGARFDALADLLVLVAGAIALLLLHPTVLAENPAWLGATAAVYVTSLVAGGETPRISSRIAGGALYGFALITFLSGDSESLLLRAALLALAVTSLMRIVAAVNTIQPRARAKTARCQAPHAANDMAISAGDVASSPTSIPPITREIPL